MNYLAHLAPMAALVIAQLAEGEGKLAIYGPMGVICLWLMYRDERRSQEVKNEKEGLYAKAEVDRQDNTKLRDEIGKVAHQMKGLNRNLLYITATHGPDGLRQVAERELRRDPGSE